MISKIKLKLKRADSSPVKAAAKILYSNTIKINRFIIYELDVAKDFDIPPLDKQFTAKVIHHRDLDQYLPEDKNLPREFEIHKIHGIEHCALVLKNNEICHISWIFMHGDRNRWFNLKKNEASLNYAYTLPEYRGKNFLPHAFLASVRWLRDKGVTRLLEASHEDTIFTIKSLKKIPNIEQTGVLVQWFIYRPKYKG